MSPVAWVRTRLALLGGAWGEGCPAGAPVPAAERCEAVHCEAVRLTALAPGERGRVTCLDAPDGPGGRRLAALGILPGVEMLLLQRSPVFVFRIGHAEFAVDEQLADGIRVQRE